MGWWDKLRKKDDGAGPAGEPAGPSPLTDADRAAIVQQVQREFAQMGREVVADGQGGLRGMDGRAFGTGNLEAQLERLPRDRWHELIANHVRIMDSTIDAPGPGSLAEVRDRLYLRLRAASALPQAPDYDSPVLPGIIGMVTIDHPEHTEELGGLSGLGTWDEIRPIALENIRALPPMRHDPVAADSERTDAVVHVFDHARGVLRRRRRALAAGHPPFRRFGHGPHRGRDRRGLHRARAHRRLRRITGGLVGSWSVEVVT